MGLLGLGAMEWFVVLDLFVLMASTTIAAALYMKIQRREAFERGLRRARGRASEQERAE